MRREIQLVLKGQPVTEGAGVKLRRVFSSREAELLDPFLMLDDFRAYTPDDFTKGFPWHPHRGIETITYVLSGDVEHGDSLGNKGLISSGDVQWMTAGNGIIHKEMPKGDENGAMLGFQLWANLPAKEKMCEPKYRGITAQMIPTITDTNGNTIKIISGTLGGAHGPMDDIAIDPEFLDCTTPSGKTFVHPTKRGHTAFIYCIDGKGSVNGTAIENRDLVLFEDGDEIEVQSDSDSHVRFLFLSGAPLNEPIAWRGPIVMNTQEEIETAFREYQQGTFIRHSFTKGD